jgi:putative ABC transport system permease protein
MWRDPVWRRYLHFWRHDVRRDVADELRFHIEERAEELMSQGMNAQDARAQASEDFGDVSSARERLEAIDRRIESRRGRYQRLEAALQDARYAWRGLRRSPAFTVTVVVTIALGIGAAVSMYGLMRRLLLDPPPQVVAPARVTRLFVSYPPMLGRPERTSDRWSYPDYTLFAEHARTAGLAATLDRSLPIGEGRDARVVRTSLVSAGFWRTLGVKPALGRFFTDEESHPVTGARRVVLGHAYWRRQYDGARDVIGRTLRVKGQSYEIVGVTPRGFRGVQLADVELWLPLYAQGDGEESPVSWHTFAGSGIISLVGRLAPDATPQQLSAELTRLKANQLEEIARPRPGRSVPRGVRVSAAPITGALNNEMKRMPEARVSVWLAWVGGILLLIACANVAGLLLLRAMQRRREIAIRTALGESRSRLAGQLVTESAVVASLGGAGALLFVAYGGGMLQRVILPAMAWEPAAALDRSMVLAMVAAVVSATLLAGLAPLVHTLRDPTGGLRDGAPASSRRSSLHATLLVTQAALTVVLLIGAGLFVRSLHNLRSLDLGIDTDNVLSAEVDFAGTGRTQTDVIAFYERALERVRALPGVEGAALSVSIPLRSARGSGFYLPGRDSVIGMPGRGLPLANYVSPGFFRTTGTRIVAGRDFTEAERQSPEYLVIVNEAIAKLYWPGQNAVGQCVQQRPGGPCGRVVGVSEDARTFRMVGEEHRLYFYRPLDPNDSDERALLVRVPPAAVATMTGTVRRAIQSLESGLPYVDVNTLQSTLDPQIRPWRLGATIFTAFGALAMLLAAIGLGSAVAFAVTQRTREIGVRLAIGAGQERVVRMVLGDALRVASVGALIGIAVALAAAPVIAELLFQVSARDTATYIVVAAAVLVLGVLATLAPALRAARIEPVVALRGD